MAQEGGDHVTVDYEGAMEQLSQMFGNFERDVIHMCLEQNQGRLEPTIDALLALSTDATADDVNNTATTPSTGPGLIDDSFLGGAPLGGGGGGGGGGMTQMEKDEALAQMLQQELFMEELSNNAEFMAALEDDHAASERRRRQRQQQRRRESQSAQDAASPPSTSTTLKQKLQNMSDATKRQFRLLSDKFMGRKTTDAERQTNARYSELPSYGAGGGIASNPDYAGELSHRHGHGVEDDEEDGNTCALPLEEGLNLDGTPRQPEAGLHDRRTVRQRAAVAESKKSQ